MRDEMEFSPETDSLLDPMADPEWDAEHFADNLDGDDFDESLYLDGADRGSAAKRRTTTTRARARRDNAKVLRTSGGKHVTIDNRTIRRIVHADLQHRRPELKRAFATAMVRFNPDRTAIVRAFPVFFNALTWYAATLVAKKARGAMTPAQIIQLPIFAAISPALAVVAKRFGGFSRQDTQQAAEAIFDMLSFGSLSIRLAAKLLGETEEFAQDESGDDFDTLVADGLDERASEDFEIFGDQDFHAAGGASPAGRISSGERATISRALRNAARQLLRLERRLGAGG